MGRDDSWEDEGGFRVAREAASGALATAIVLRTENWYRREREGTGGEGWIGDESECRGDE